MAEEEKPVDASQTIVASVVITLSLSGEIRSQGGGLDRSRLNMMMTTAHQDLLEQLKAKPE